MKRCFLSLFALCLTVSVAFAHCQVPCGIYGDQLRFEQMLEDEQTISKSQLQIHELTAGEIDAQAVNQIGRWVATKEEHATKIQQTIAAYFMAQRIKLPAAGDAKAKAEYVKNLSLLHELLVYSMKAKQTTDAQYVEKLRTTLNTFHNAYGHAH